jgi:hypothetical protein
MRQSVSVIIFPRSLKGVAARDNKIMDEDCRDMKEIIKKSEAVLPPANFTEKAMSRIALWLYPVETEKNIFLNQLQKSLCVIPSKDGIQSFQDLLDPGVAALGDKATETYFDDLVFYLRDAADEGGDIGFLSPVQK